MMEKPNTVWNTLKGDSDARKLQEMMDAVSDVVMKSSLLSACMAVDFPKVKQTVGAESYVAAVREMADIPSLDDVQKIMRTLHGIHDVKKRQE